MTARHGARGLTVSVKSGDSVTALQEPSVIERVGDLIRKRQFPRDPEGRVLEDAVCLVFLETQLAPTTTKTGQDKMIEILHRTWHKMTPQARQIALAMPLEPAQRELLQQTLHGAPPS